MSFVKTEFVEALLANSDSQASCSPDEDTSATGSGLRRRGSFTAPARKFFISHIMSESDSELEKVGRNSHDFAQNTFDEINLRALRAFDRAQIALDQVEDFVQHVWDVVGHHSLPDWLKDNDYLVSGHRPQLNSYWACFKSIFRMHSETGNIWSHLLGCVAFIFVATYILLQPSVEMELKDKTVFIIYCIGAILCMGFSWLFHTLYCHSPPVGKLFGKLDYCGISIMVMASFVPWVYYGFYCETIPKIVYITMSVIFGVTCIFVSMKEKFAEASYRAMRATLFIAFGLSGVIPVIHFIITHGFYHAFKVSPISWGVLIAFLYIAGALIYAYRIPERFWPGRFDYWGQSHQIFHLFVVAAAFTNYHAMNILNKMNLGSDGECALATAI